MIFPSACRDSPRSPPALHGCQGLSMIERHTVILERAILTDKEVLFIWSHYEDGSPVQMELNGPSKCTKLTRPNERRSNGPPMLRQFAPSKWTMVQWTAYVTSIWTVHLNIPLDRLYYSNLERPKLRLLTVILDHPKIRLLTIILDRPKLRLLTVTLDNPK